MSYPQSIRSSHEEVLATCCDWLDAGHAVRLATVVKTFGSSPRPLGSIAAIRDDGLLVGSVSGGCVERQLAQSLETDDKSKNHAFTIDDATAQGYGLSCGGSLELVFETLERRSWCFEAVRLLDKGITVRRSLTSNKDAPSQIQKAESSEFVFENDKLSHVFGSTWRVLLIGAGQLSHYVAQFAQAADFSVSACEPREHIRHAWTLDSVPCVDVMPDDSVIDMAPNAQSAVLALTHEPSLDDFALLEAIRSPAFFIGALGSRKSHQNRVGRLERLGGRANDIARIHGPVGLDIGSRSSAEIALSIVAALVKERSEVTNPAH